MRGKPTYDELREYVSELEARIEDLESKLEDNREKTERLKSRFLSSISHELRTPMNAILGFSNLMVDKNLPHDKKEEYMEHINMNSNSLLSLVDAMIDVSLLEIGELKVKKERCNLDMLMQQIYHYFSIDKHKMGKDHIALLLNKYRSEGNFMIYTDPYRLTQVLSNLLHNALKFTNKGIIEFGYFTRDDDKLEFFVKDSGKGILAEKARLVFNKFEKLDDDETGRPESGLGLGLTLANGIIQILGGEIWIESNIFKGSTFSFTIEYKEKAEYKTEQAKIFQSLFV